MVINMKINIYYGGRGLIDDPTLFVIGKMQEVLEELRVKVERFNLYELKNGITALPQSLKDADGNEMTQKEVADVLGISQSYISRLEKKIMKRLKKEIVRFE